MTSYLEALRSTPEFQALIVELKGKRPVIPAYTHSPDNTEDWRANSNQLQGFNLCLTLLGEKDA